MPVALATIDRESERDEDVHEDGAVARGDGVVDEAAEGHRDEGVECHVDEQACDDRGDGEGVAAKPAGEANDVREGTHDARVTRLLRCRGWKVVLDGAEKGQVAERGLDLGALEKDIPEWLRDGGDEDERVAREGVPLVADAGMIRRGGGHSAVPHEPGKGSARLRVP
jgi:hypothetical protein